MTDILIREVSESAIAEIDRQAREMGVSRNELLRRWLSRDFRPPIPVTNDDLSRLGNLVQDLDDAHIMRDAWS